MIKNCRECGKAFLYTGVSSRCPSCISREEDEFEKVLSYVKKNPNEELKVVSEATEVRESRISKWVKEGRLIAVTGVVYKCERCNKTIDKGKLCDKCALKFKNEVSESLANSKKPYFLSKDNNND